MVANTWALQNGFLMFMMFAPPNKLQSLGCSNWMNPSSTDWDIHMMKVQNKNGG